MALITICPRAPAHHVRHGLAGVRERIDPVDHDLHGARLNQRADVLEVLA
jgi:hypothetical protein